MRRFLLRKLISFYNKCRGASEKCILGEWINLIRVDPNPSEISVDYSVAEEKRRIMISRLPKTYPEIHPEAHYTSRYLSNINQFQSI